MRNFFTTFTFCKGYKNMKFLRLLVISFLWCNALAQNNMHENQSTNSSINTPDYNQAIIYLSEKWQLDNVQPFVYEFVFYHYVARAYSNLYQQEVVVKIDDSNEEAHALQYLQNDGMVKLLDYDEDYCALLLEYIPTQGCLTDYILAGNDDDIIIDIFATLFKKIHGSPHRGSTTNYPLLQDRFALLQSYNFTKIPQPILHKAQQLYHQLFADEQPHYLLHCDLHCQNILQSNETFIAIDPWPAMGPLVYDVAPFFVCPTDFLLTTKNTLSVLQNRLNRLSDILDLDKQALKDCAFMRLILLACIYETRNINDEWIDKYMQLAEIIEQLEV